MSDAEQHAGTHADMTYWHPLNPNHADYRQGHSDGGDFNPRFEPLGRSGPALEAYTSGYREGNEDMGTYYEGE